MQRDHSMEVDWLLGQVNLDPISVPVESCLRTDYIGIVVAAAVDLATLVEGFVVAVVDPDSCIDSCYRNNSHCKSCSALYSVVVAAVVGSSCLVTAVAAVADNSCDNYSLLHSYFDSFDRIRRTLDILDCSYCSHFGRSNCCRSCYTDHLFRTDLHSYCIHSDLDS